MTFFLEKYLLNLGMFHAEAIVLPAATFSLIPRLALGGLTILYSFRICK